MMVRYRTTLSKDFADMNDKKDQANPFRMALLLKAAAERFLDQGYDAVSIDSLIQQVGG